MILYPHTKINVGLSVIGKRPNGFHNIETVFYPIPLCDILTVESACRGRACPRPLTHRPEFVCEGIKLPNNEPDDNLCCKAYQLVDADFNLPPTRIHLRKIIPVGAGLGGGSSDAVFVLKALNDLYQLQLSNEKMTEYASQLGSDCAFFLQNTPAFGTGRGDKLEPVSLSFSDYRIFLVKAPVFVSTAEAYSSVIPQKASNYLPDILKEPVSNWRQTVFNDFEEFVFKKYPEIGNIKERLYREGAIYASMSGSGASVYGIFNECPKDIEKHFPNYFCWGNF